jgi:subtilisin family serine protease
MRWLMLVLMLSGLFSYQIFSLYPANSSIQNESTNFVKGQVLVKIAKDQTTNTIAKIKQKFDIKWVRSYELVEGLSLFQFDPDRDVMEIVKSLSKLANVIYAEPNYIYEILNTDSHAIVNDPEYFKQWALKNIGQSGGLEGADINAELMWSHQTGSRDIVVGIIDTGIDYTHQDLIENLWNNPGEIPGNGQDDDQNGYIDDIHGVNAIKNNGNPMDDNVHGTHVAGIIGAAGNNNTGVVGVAQKILLTACKFLSSGGSGNISDAIQCMEYFADLKSRSLNPVNIIATNNSWGGGGHSQSMFDAIKAHQQLGILFIAAAGNERRNNDTSNSYPANYDINNVISVAATDHNDHLASFSNYGKKTVHVAAPGVKILSTVLNHKYGELSGTSMAAPHVTGLAAIIASQFRHLSYQGIKNLILTGGEQIDSTLNTTISGRRIRGADDNGMGSLTCNNQLLTVRKSPASNTHRIRVEQPFFLSALHINCANAGGAITLHQNSDGDIVLKDNGEDGDITANDGIYSLSWIPQKTGVYQLKFTDNDIVNITVYDHSNFAPYRADDKIPFEYITIGGTRLNANDDTMHHIQSPFPIIFGGSPNGFLDLFISSNGTISFTDRNQPGFHNQKLPTMDVDTLVAPYWDDLTTINGTSDIYVEVIGSAPDRKLIVEWWRIKHYSATGLGAFQVVFYENSPNFQFNYLDTNFSHESYDYGASATVGVQVSQDDALEYSYNSPNIQSHKSIFFSLEKTVFSSNLTLEPI